MGRGKRAYKLERGKLLRNPETQRVGLESEVDFSIPKENQGLCQFSGTVKNCEKCDGYGKINRGNGRQQTCHSYAPTRIDS